MRKLIFVLVIGALLAMPSTAAAQTTVNPKDGTVVAHLVPVPSSDIAEDAEGRAIFNYKPGTDSFEVQLTVTGLEANTEYELHIAIHQEKAVANFGTFTTDLMGSGNLHVAVDEIDEFNIINVRIPNVGGSRKLTSWEEDGGSLMQTPDQRNAARP